MKEYLLAALLLIFSLSTVSYVDVVYASTVHVQTHSEIKPQSAPGTESDITQTNPHPTTTNIGNVGFSAIEQIGTASHYTTQTGHTETFEIYMIQQESQHTGVNTLTTETFEIYQNQYSTGVNTLTIMEGSPAETNQNQPFTNANTLTTITDDETNQNQYSSVNTLTTITGVNTLTDVSAHESSEAACPEKR